MKKEYLLDNSLAEAAESMLKIVDVQYPNMENHKKYERIRDLFEKLYNAVKGTYVEQHTL